MSPADMRPSITRSPCVTDSCKWPPRASTGPVTASVPALASMMPLAENAPSEPMRLAPARRAAPPATASSRAAPIRPPLGDVRATGEPQSAGGIHVVAEQDPVGAGQVDVATGQPPTRAERAAAGRQAEGSGPDIDLPGRQRQRTARGHLHARTTGRAHDGQREVVRVADHDGSTGKRDLAGEVVAHVVECDRTALRIDRRGTAHPQRARLAHAPAVAGHGQGTGHRTLAQLQRAMLVAESVATSNASSVSALASTMVAAPPANDTVPMKSLPAFARTML